MRLMKLKRSIKKCQWFCAYLSPFVKYSVVQRCTFVWQIHIIKKWIFDFGVLRLAHIGQVTLVIQLYILYITQAFAHSVKSCILDAEVICWDTARDDYAAMGKGVRVSESGQHIHTL